MKQTDTSAKKSSIINSLMIKIIVKLRTIVILQVNARLLHVVYVIAPEEIPVVFHNRSNKDYHFIIKELVK